MENFISSFNQEQKKSFNQWLNTLLERLSSDNQYRANVLSNKERAFEKCPPELLKSFSLKIVGTKKGESEFEIKGNTLILKLPSESTKLSDEEMDAVSGGYTKIKVTEGPDGKLYFADNVETDRDFKLEGDIRTGSFRVTTSDG